MGLLVRKNLKDYKSDYIWDKILQSNKVANRSRGASGGYLTTNWIIWVWHRDMKFIMIQCLSLIMVFKICSNEKWLPLSYGDLLDDLWSNGEQQMITDQISTVKWNRKSTCITYCLRRYGGIFFQFCQTFRWRHPRPGTIEEVPDRWLNSRMK